MSIYSVFVGPHFFKSFKDEDSAKYLVESLRIFFEVEHLPYKASIKYEVI